MSVKEVFGKWYRPHLGKGAEVQLDGDSNCGRLSVQQQREKKGDLGKRRH